MLVAISIAQSIGLISSWLPAEQVRSLQVPHLSLEGNNASNQADLSPSKQAVGKKPTLANANVAAVTSQKPFTVPSEAMADLKKALEVKKGTEKGETVSCFSIINK